MAELQYPYRGLKLPRRLLGMLYHTERYEVRLRAAQEELHTMAAVLSLAVDADERLLPFRDKVGAIQKEFQQFVDGYHRLHYGINPVNYSHYIIVRQMVAGNKVMAIKELRARSGLGLKEAKDICDILHHKLWCAQRTDLGRADHYAKTQLPDPSHYEILAALELAAEL